MKNPKYPTVFCDEQGQHLVMNTDGNVIGGTLLTRVTDEAGGEIPTVLIKMLCNIATNREEAMLIYKNNPSLRDTNTYIVNGEKVEK